MKLAIILAAVLLFVSMESALALPDNIYITVPNGSERYIVVQLPDDSGWAGKGEVEYTVSMAPEPSKTWSDFSEQIVRTDENNTVQIPIYFKRKSNASCGEQFAITISSAVTDKVIHGGACESSIAGVSTAPSGEGESAASALNQNFGAFDMAFSEQNHFATPNGIANVTVLAGSYQDNANVHLVLSSGGGLAADAAGSLSVSPAYHDISFGAAGGQRRVVFQVQAPGSGGTYALALSGNIEGCSAQACSITRHAGLVVGAAPPRMGGFIANIFPASISTSAGRPVTFTLTIGNNEVARSFNLSTLVPAGIQLDLNQTELQIAADAEKSVDFTVTATGGFDSYEFAVYINSGENTKLVTGYLNVNGMDAGSQRSLEMVAATGDQQAMQQAGRAYDNYRSNPSLNSYGTLQDELNRLASQKPAGTGLSNITNATAQPIIPVQNYTPPVAQPTGLDILGKDMWILIAVVGAGFVVSVVLFMKRGRKPKAAVQESKYKEVNPYKL